jgi:hypothetical protein
MKNGIGKSGTLIPMLIPCQKGQGSRIAGWTVMHQYLYHDMVTPPKMRYFRNCADSIRTIPSLVYSEVKPEDLDSDGEDHAADIDRYLLQTLRNRKAKLPEKREQKKMREFQKMKGLIHDDVVRLDRFINL